MQSYQKPAFEHVRALS